MFVVIVCMTEVTQIRRRCYSVYQEVVHAFHYNVMFYSKT